MLHAKFQMTGKAIFWHKASKPELQKMRMVYDVRQSDTNNPYESGSFTNLEQKFSKQCGFKDWERYTSQSICVADMNESRQSVITVPEGVKKMMYVIIIWILP